MFRRFWSASVNDGWAMNGLITIGAYSVALNPILPWPVLIAFGVLYGGLILFALTRRARGTTWRVVAGLLLVFALLDPSLVEEQRNYQKDIAVVLVDRSPSQNLGNRARETNEALTEVQRQLALLTPRRTRPRRSRPGFRAPTAVPSGT